MIGHVDGPSPLPLSHRYDNMTWAERVILVVQASR